MPKKLLRNTQRELIVMKKQIFDQLIKKKIKRNQASTLLSMHLNAISRLKKRYEENGEDVFIPQKLGPRNYCAYNKTSFDVEKK